VSLWLILSDVKIVVAYVYYSWLMMSHTHTQFNMSSHAIRPCSDQLSAGLTVCSIVGFAVSFDNEVFSRTADGSWLGSTMRNNDVGASMYTYSMCIYVTVHLQT